MRKDGEILPDIEETELTAAANVPLFLKHEIWRHAVEADPIPLPPLHELFQPYSGYRTSPGIQIAQSDLEDRTVSYTGSPWGTTSESIKSLAAENGVTAARTIRARDTLIPELLAYNNTSAQAAFFVLYANCTDNEISDYRKFILVDSVYGFMYPNPEILQNLGNRFFAIVDKVIPASGTLPAALQNGGEEAVLQALINMKTIAELLHIPTAQNSWIAEDFYLYIASRIPGFTSPHISTHPYRDNPESLAIDLHFMKEDVAGQMFSLLGIQQQVDNIYVLDVISKYYGLDKLDRDRYDPRVYALADIGMYYVLTDLLDKLALNPHLPVLNKCRDAAKELATFPRSFDSLEGARKREDIDWLVAIAPLLNANSDDTLLRDALARALKISQPAYTASEFIKNLVMQTFEHIEKALNVRDINKGGIRYSDYIYFYKSWNTVISRFLRSSDIKPNTQLLQEVFTANMNNIDIFQRFGDENNPPTGEVFRKRRRRN